MMRKVLAIPAGVVVLGVVVVLLQSVSVTLHPLPEGLDPSSPEDLEAFREHMVGMPAWATFIGFASELIGGFLGALTAGLVAQKHTRVFSGIIIGLALLGSVVNWTTFEHPTWFIVGQLVGYPAVLAAAWAILARREAAAGA